VEGYDTASWETPLDAEVVQALNRAYRTALGREPRHNVPPQLPPGSGYALKVSTDLHHLARWVSRAPTPALEAQAPMGRMSMS